MTAGCYVVCYASLLVFLVACVVRAVAYARYPIHLRWELYPVPHEARHRVGHGGSYFEDVDWWTKKKESNLTGEMGAMIPEMLFLKALFEHNRPMWFRSFPFHFGLYLLIGAAGILFASAILGFLIPVAMAGTLGLVLHFAYTAFGMAGAALAVIGALGLLHSRLTDPKLKTYTVAGDIFNLLFFLVAFGVLIAGTLSRGPEEAGFLELTRGLLTFDTQPQISALFGAGLVLCALLAAYIPLTHMSHFIGKYFTYHSVRWNDQVNLRGGEIEAKLAEYLTYKPTWSAPHVMADGSKTWAEVATTNPAQGTKK
jgi:nitrate reductase gamma subunit